LIDETDNWLREWVHSVLPNIELSFDAPTNETKPGVNAYLVQLGSLPPPRGHKRSPVQFSLRYLLTTWASNAEESHKLLGTLVAAAMQEEDFEVEFDLIDWRAFEVVPRPCFTIKVPARVPLPDPAIGIVRQPLVLEATPITHLSGRVLGPRDVPIAGAYVQLPALNASVRTDNDGWFVMPVGARKQQINVTAKGRLKSLLAEPSQESPLIIRFDELED
jgi:hypothetical protein